jgi:hypothetical protein
MEPTVLIFIALAAFLMLGWNRGGRINTKILLDAVETMERVFSPLDKTYTNIGGVVGYNFEYRIAPPFKRLEGTITTLPRHAVLYLPISRRLLGREDRLLFTLYCEELRTGRGHIVNAEGYRRGTIPVEDADNPESTTVEREAGTFLILWYNPMIRDRMAEMLGQLSDTATECIRYIGYYGSEGHLAVTVNPGHPELETALREVITMATGSPAR